MATLIRKILLTFFKRAIVLQRTLDDFIMKRIFKNRCRYLWTVCLILGMIVVIKYTIQFTSVQHGRKSSEVMLVVVVFSDRHSFTRRQTIRQTWGSFHDNVFFMVNGHYCQYPPEQRVASACLSNDEFVSTKSLYEYHRMERHTTERLHNEQNVALLPIEEILTTSTNIKINEAYNWMMKNTNLKPKWLLFTNDESVIRVNSLEHYLRTTFQKDSLTIIEPMSHDQTASKSVQNVEVESLLSMYLLTEIDPVTFVVSASIAKHITEEMARLSEDTRFETRTPLLPFNAQLRRVKSEYMNNDGDCFAANQLVSSQVKQLDKMVSCFRHLDEIYEKPDKYLHSFRFDVIVKIVYAYFYVVEKYVPDIIELAYTEHERVWNGFTEDCKRLDTSWVDRQKPCLNKSTKSDFVFEFQHTIDNIQDQGFDQQLSQIPVDSTGYIMNGAHRLATAIVLSKYVTFQHVDVTNGKDWDYKFFIRQGLSSNLADLVMLEFMRIQLNLANLTTRASMLSLFGDHSQKDEEMLKIVKERCSKDNSILYDKKINVTKTGMTQLVTHMYGRKTFVETKIKHMLSKFKTTTLNVRFIFFFGKDVETLTKCKLDIRTLYNDPFFKSSCHIPDTPEESLILAEMILNPNSVKFLNYAKNPHDCRTIAEEISLRSSTAPITTLPGLYIGRDDVMIDSGSVMHLFGLRKLTDVDILFLHAVDRTILGSKRGMLAEAHAFISNGLPTERAWGQDHFNEQVKTKWDLFYDPNNYGYCYGIKFVSLQQLLRYKLKRNEPGKDINDAILIRQFLNKTMNI